MLLPNRPHRACRAERFLALRLKLHFRHPSEAQASSIGSIRTRRSDQGLINVRSLPKTSWPKRHSASCRCFCKPCSSVGVAPSRRRLAVAGHADVVQCIILAPKNVISKNFPAVKYIRPDETCVQTCATTAMRSSSTICSAHGISR